MDAKPQRIRVRGDENAPPILPGNKTIHQRNKSSPALSTLAQNGGLRNGAKRTAFGDVSNTTKPVRSSKDDASLAGKNIPTASQKPVSLAQERKPAILAQPAQRPLSVTGLRGILNNVTNFKPTEAPGKQVPGDKVLHSASNSRKLLNKRSNPVFKDPLPSIAEPKPSAAKETNTRPTEPSKEDRASRPPTVQSQRPVGPSLEEKPEPIEASKDHVDLYSDAQVPEGCPDLRSDGAYIDETGEVKDYEDYCHVHSSEANMKHRVDATKAGAQESNRSAPKVISQPAAKALNDSIDLAHARYDSGPAHSEPEEYWDDEDEENEEDDGYVTATYRCRGDNTTGGATTVLFPKYNQRVKRELAIAKQIVEATRTTEDIEDEYWDTSMVAEYGDEIFDYMRELEMKMLPNAHYMDNQAEIQWSMRSVLMDWLVQVHHRFSLLPETLFLCVNYIDRFLSCKIVSLGKLQLVGATAIFIAAKYEEINCPSVQEIVYMVDGGYTVDEILKAERFMLSMLQFELGWPGPMSFLRRISKADDYDLETRTLAKYFLEVTIMDERFVGCPPSFTAAGAHCLARMMLKKGTWTPAHVYYSNYTYSQLYPLVSLILECCENPQKHHAAIFEKYTDKRFKRASLFVEAEVKKGFRALDVAKDSFTAHVNGTLDYGHSWKQQ
ncbi:hypothetical protein VTN00DRAFT_3938 [Thermoascus crustaceus]|uniref:uncharacterized protein n=1 Tax=Thermoascus crustaceus TaxID=5088 RepID=UPI0037441CCD